MSEAKIKRGLYDKYKITRTDGTPIDPDDEYFVLKLSGSGDPAHMDACRKAVLRYAFLIREHLPELSTDLLTKYGAPINPYL